ncbi:hypothetical protein BJY01DRAFT_249429 [Aspergillus pseudoustus]|uniref:Nucleotide-diphospho-sugar transferase n=1 Tax=Aspergillus pseudoustus TaxID=1810923 RepID=A0ABR4JNR4_9EURO
MLAILLALILVPFALTSPMVSASATLVVRGAIDLYYFYPYYYYTSLVSFTEDCFNYMLQNLAGLKDWAVQLNCGQKCRQKIRRLIEKRGVFGALTTLLPTDTQIYIHWLLADDYTIYFICLFLFRYVRVIVNLFSLVFLNCTTPVPRKSRIRRSDCTVIIPVTDPESQDFDECLMSCLINEPGEVLIMTSSPEMTTSAKHLAIPFMQRFPYTKITVKNANVANKRMQIAGALGYINTKITVLLDEHAFWPSARFLPALLAPFQNPVVGIVGTTIRARREQTKSNWRSFLNMLGIIDVDRQSLDVRAIAALDGGVSAVSSLTSAHRSEILTNPVFVKAYMWEYLGWGTFGPFPVDESTNDNFITRWTVKEGYKVRIQSSHDACIETALPQSLGLLVQSLQTARTSFRNCCASITAPITWFRHPWSTYAVSASTLLDFSLFYDIALVYTLYESRLGEAPQAFFYLSRWMLGTKLIEIIPYFLREPSDILMAPGYLLWSYIQSVLKIYAMLTFWDTGSGERGSIDLTYPAPPRRLSYHIEQVGIDPPLLPSAPVPQQPVPERSRPAPEDRVAEHRLVEIPETPQHQELAQVTPPAVKKARGRPKKPSPVIHTGAGGPGESAPQKQRRRQQQQQQFVDLGVIESIEEPLVPTTPTTPTKQVKRGRGRPRKNLT